MSEQTKAIQCPICLRRVASEGMCRLCQRSYDRMNANDRTAWGLLQWAANRAWWFARKAQRECR